MAIVEIIAIAFRFFFSEFPKLLEKYKLYRLDKSYKDKEEAYLEAMNDYKKAKLEGNDLEKLKQLRKLGKK